MKRNKGYNGPFSHKNRKMKEPEFNLVTSGTKHSPIISNSLRVQKNRRMHGVMRPLHF